MTCDEALAESKMPQQAGQNEPTPFCQPHGDVREGRPGSLTEPLAVVDLRRAMLVKGRWLANVLAAEPVISDHRYGNAPAATSKAE